jgi:hypothetical protein
MLDFTAPARSLTVELNDLSSGNINEAKITAAANQVS